MSPIDKKIAEHASSAEAVWGLAYSKFYPAVAAKKLKVGVEVGVAFAGHSEAILQGTDIKRLYGVDPYTHMRGYDDPMNLPQKEFDALYAFVKRRMSKFGDRYKHIRGFSDLALRTIKETVDFIYIDADHSYEGVWNDLVAWYPKIRVGGIIGGHDYGHVNFPGVKQAIDEFFRRFGWDIHEEGEGVWWVEKKAVPISFIMPAYNAEKTISASIESIMKGNFRSGDELVVVNDKSTDKTAYVLSSLQKKYKSIKIVEHAFNKGGGAARNTAVENSRNQLLFCLDSDNILANRSVDKLRDFLESSGADVASFETLRYFKSTPSQTTHTWKFAPKSATFEGALSNTKFPGASGNYLFTKESWLRAGRYPESAGALDAWGFGFRQVATGSKMKVLPRYFYYHRYGHDSYWVRESKKGTISLMALQLLIPFIDRLDPDDVDYIMSGSARYTWFDNLEVRSIRIRQEGTQDEKMSVVEEGAPEPPNHKIKIRSVLGKIKRKIL